MIRIRVIFLITAVVVAFAAVSILIAAERKTGDFNGNGEVDSDDLFDFAYYFNLQRGDPIYEEEGFQADFDSNGRVDEMDLFKFSEEWYRAKGQLGGKR